jgi:hypothetical protein
MEKEKWPGRMVPASVFSVELPGIEPAALPGLLPPELPVCYISFPFSTSRYRRFRFGSWRRQGPSSPILFSRERLLYGWC